MKKRISKFVTACSAVVLSLACLTSAYAQSEDGLVWGYSQFNDPENKGKSTSHLSFAIPETDAVAVLGSCVVGSSGNFSNVVFGTDTQGLSEGQTVNVRFRVGETRRILPGEIYGTQAEVGVSGVNVTIDNDDPLWDALKRGNRVTYTVRGKSTTFSLKGSRKPIENFIADCRFYAGAFSGETDNEENSPALSNFDDPRRAKCKEARFQKSVKSETPVAVVFRNKTEEHRSVMWMGFDGQPVQYADLNPGEEFTANTYLTHPWMFTDGPGNCMEMFLPQLGVDTFNITAPHPQ